MASGRVQSRKGEQYIEQASRMNWTIMEVGGGQRRGEQERKEPRKPMAEMA